LVSIVPKEAKRLRLDRAALYPRPEGKGFTAEEDKFFLFAVRLLRA
jgi:hypothetical protein